MVNDKGLITVCSCSTYTINNAVSGHFNQQNDALINGFGLTGNKTTIMSLPYIDVNPTGEVKAVVIWLHGLGDTGHGFAPIVPELKLPQNLGIRFVFPHAPMQAVTINNGMQMNAWYDIKSMDMNGRADEAGVIDSSAKIEALIKAEMAKGIGAEKIVLAGFSQGGVIALHLSTRFEHKLAGVMGLSTYMCQPQNLAAQKHSANQQTPFFMAHGQMDDMVPLMAGEQAKSALVDCGYDVKWQDYPMQHNVCAQEVNDISSWLQQVLA
jgi:phospholipase/carboxylesterase